MATPPIQAKPSLSRAIQRVASFSVSATDVAVNTLVTFTNTSTGTEPLTALWDFGDGTPIVTTTRPIHAYATAGIYTVTLLASNLYGSDSSQQIITVGEPAIARFTVSAQTAKMNEVLTLTNTSTGTAPLSYIWDFGDGLTSTLNTPTHIYASVGVFTLSLTTSNTYRTDNLRQHITIEPYCIALPLIFR